MRRWIIYAVILGASAMLNVTGFVGTDVGKLLPVQAVRVTKAGNMVIMQTDTGDIGIGTNPVKALGDMQDSAAGNLFLETADYLILQPGCEELLPELAEILRPSCKVCTEDGETDPEAAAEYLAVHEPAMTLRDWLGGERNIPTLMVREGRMELAS